MIALAAVGIAAQVADLLWQRDDPRVGGPASAVFTAALCLLLALYPNGRSVPRWRTVAIPRSDTWGFRSPPSPCGPGTPNPGSPLRTCD